MNANMNARLFYSHWLKRLGEDGTYVIEDIAELKSTFPQEYALLCGPTASAG